MKLNVLLGKTDHLASIYKRLVEDYIKFFKSNQSAFRGEKKTYQVAEGMIDEPGQRKNQIIVTTVEEKLKYLEDTAGDYIDALFSQEKTNATGNASASLVVDGVSWGTFTTLELLRLKSLIEHGTFVSMYENIPVRSDDEIWTSSKSTDYANRSVWETEKVEGDKKGTVKESYILTDPNIAKVDGAKYTPQLAHKDTVVTHGRYSYQKFSGEWSHRERAELLGRRSKLLSAVIVALKEANECEVTKSDITAKRIFEYLHRGK